MRFFLENLRCLNCWLDWFSTLRWLMPKHQTLYSTVLFSDLVTKWSTDLTKPTLIPLPSKLSGSLRIYKFCQKYCQFPQRIWGVKSCKCGTMSRFVEHKKLEQSFQNVRHDTQLHKYWNPCEKCLSFHFIKSAITKEGRSCRFNYIIKEDHWNYVVVRKESITYFFAGMF